MPLNTAKSVALKPLQDTQNTDAFMPSAERPVRVRSRHLPADSHFEPHRHPWAQLAYCSSGVLQVTVLGAQETTSIVPSSRAVWIPPAAMHVVAVVEEAQFRSIYIDAQLLHFDKAQDWSKNRVITVSALLRELIHALGEAATAVYEAKLHGSSQPESALREQSLATLIAHEISAASTQSLGVPMPSQGGADRRLRALCEAVIQRPAAHKTLAQWAGSVGMSERTAARLFKQELAMGFTQWRQQAVLAHALPLLARGMPVGQVAPICGYDSVSAFTAMFKTALGHAPGYFSEK